MFNSIVRTCVFAIVIAVVAGVALQQFGLLAAPQTTANAPVNVQISPVILEKVKNVNKQIFVEHYSTVDIDYTEVPQGPANILKKIGIQQHYVVLLRGTVTAGFDLTTMEKSDIWISPDGKRAQVTLPPPQIFSAEIDNENTRILVADDKCPDFLCTEDMSAFKDAILPSGQQRLTDAALENGILRQSAIQGKQYYESLLNQLGIGEVRVVVKGYDL